MSEPKDLTWNDVLTRLNTFTPQQLAMPACILDMNNEDGDVAAVLGAANGCPDTAVKVTEAILLTLRPLGTAFPTLKLIDQYLVVCGTALLDNLKAAPTVKLTDYDRILLLASLLEQTDTNDVLNHTDHATALLNHPQFQQLLK